MRHLQIFGLRHREWDGTSTPIPLPSEVLPAWLSRLARVTLIVVASTATARRASTTPTGASTAPTRSSTPTAAGTATAAETSAALGLGTRFIDVQCTATEFLAVEGRNGLLSLGGVGHFYESKPARTPGVTVRNNTDLVDFSVGLKQSPQLGFGCAVGDVADKKFLHNVSFSS
jgi:hypothetical protein